ncbi:uncharacterized protein TNCV_1615021 [Trichonephila clavipes]|nr:uncharacterized protein TNCV_1615021 [Trichonephila clavipes]
MDPIDAFPEHLSTTVVPVTLPDKPDALEYAARQGQVRAGIIYQEPTAKRVFVLFCKDHWHQKKTCLDNLKRAVMEAKHVNEFRPNDVMWEKTSKGLLRNPDRLLKNTDKRMLYIYNNIFFAKKKDFTFGLRTVKSGEIHLIQTTHVPMLIYELPASSLKCRAQPNVIRRSFEPHDQMLYHRTILEPHTAYPIPAGTHYIVLTVQNRLWFGHYPRIPSAPAHSEGIPRGDFRKNEKIPDVLEPVPIPDVPPSPVHIPQPPVQIPDVLEPPVQIPQPPVQIPDVLEPVQIPLVPQSPVQIPVSQVLEPPVQIPVSQVPEPPVQIPLVQIPDVPEHVQIPVSHVSEPPVQIPVSQVPQSPVQIPLVQIPDVPEHVQIPVSQVPQPPMQILPEPMNILHVSEPVQIPVSQVPQPPMQILHVSEPVQIPVSQVSQSPVQILHVSEPVQIPVSQVPQSPVQIPPVQSLPEPMQLLPELDILDPLGSTDAFDQLMSFVFGPQELQLLHTVPCIFDGDLFSFLDEFEMEPMDLTMPRLNSCVKNIRFKPIQPMDLSVNSSIGQ